MSNVLIALSPGTDAPRAVGQALRHAKEMHGNLIVLVTLPLSAAEQIAATLADEAFVGEKVSEDVIDALAHEQRKQAESLLAKIATQAENEGVALIPLIETGELREICGRVVAAHNVQLAVVVAEKRSWFTRLLSRSTPVELPALFGCEVKVLEY